MHDGFAGPLFGMFAAFTIAIMLWSLVWKGLALWNAARNRQLPWFIVLLIVNTAGILEIIYLLFFREDRDTRPFASLFNVPKQQTSKSGDLPVAESSPAE